MVIPSFLAGGCGAVGFQMGGVDHQLLGIAEFSGQFGQNPVEYAEPAPADEAIVDRLVRTIFPWCVPPSKSVA
jgi:hypothetical protein